MTNKYITDTADIPSDFNLSNQKSKQLLAKVKENRKSEARTEMVKSNPKVKEDLDYEDDFEQARKNIAKLLKTSAEAIDEYYEMAITTDSPRAFEVLNNMIKSTVEMNKDFLDIHQQKAKLKQTKGNPMPLDGTQPQNIGTQNNIMMSPADLVNMLRGEEGGNEKDV